MAAPVTFGLYNNDGTPSTTAVPVFVDFKAGGVRTRPVINRLSGGQYGFQPSNSDEGSPKTPRTVGRGRNPGKAYPSHSRRFRFADLAMET